MFSFKSIINQNSIAVSMNSDELHKLQRLLLFCYSEIKEVCDKYNIKVFAVGGTLLGLRRHKGFIPWDDDLDLGMCRDDYNKFVNIVKDELGDRYEFSIPQKGFEAKNRFIKLYRKNTEIISTLDGDNLLKEKLFVDIFPVDYVPQNVVNRYMKGIWCNFLMAIAGCVSMYQTHDMVLKRIMKKTIIGNILFEIRMIIGFIFSFNRTTKWMQLVDKAIQHNKKSNFVTIAVGRSHYFGEMLSADVVFPLRSSRFEDVDMFEMNKTDEYLSNLYGNDYMELPPVDKRESHNIKAVKCLFQIED